MFPEYFSLFGECILIAACVVLFFKKSAFVFTNRLLALTFLLMAIYGFLMLLLNHAQRFHSENWLRYYFQYDLLVGMLIGPSLYVYVQFLLDEKLTLKQLRLWPHALSVLPALGFMVYFSTLPEADRVQQLLADYHTITWADWCFTLVFYLQLLSYFVCCILQIRPLRSNGYRVYRQGFQSQIKWLYTFIWVALVVLLITIPISLCGKCDAIYTLLGMLVVYFLVGYYLFYSLAYTGFVNHMEQAMTKPSERFLSIDEAQVEGNRQKLRSAVADSQIYLHVNCSLADVAALISMNKNQLSTLLNVHFKKNFADFINEYRVAEACRLLDANEKGLYTLEAIGERCGFGSRWSFFRAFKKQLGINPSEYQKGNLLVSKPLINPSQ